MTDYLDEVEGRNFMDLSENEQFQRDLVRVFNGSRFGLTREEIRERGPEGLADDFVRHMRFQSTNETTAINDLRYVRDTDNVPEDEIQAFGRLITAYDRSEGGGTGMLEGAWDYVSAFATSPSTLATVATGGWGLGTKLAARAAGKSTQLFIRDQVADLVRQGVATSQIRDRVAGTVAGGAIRGGLTSAAVEGAVGAGQAAATLEVREEAAGQEYTAGDVLREAVIAGTIGGGAGSAARAWDVRTQREVVTNLASRESAAILARQQAREAATTTITAADDTVAEAALDRAVNVAQLLEAREARTTLDPLDPELVERGNLLKREILSNTGDRAITAALDTNTVRGIAAATIDLTSRLDIAPNERISSAVSRALREGTLDTEALTEIRNTYNLSREELSYIFLADLSEAGRTLAEASRISRATSRRAGPTVVEAATRDVDEVAADLATLAQRDISTIAEADARGIVSQVYSGGNVLGGIYRTVQELDGVRIAFMTSQLGTTAANTATSAGNILIDISDNFWKNSLRLITGSTDAQGRVQRRWVGGTLSTLRGLTWGQAEARLTRQILLQDRPDEYNKLFFETTRAEVAMEGSSLLARAARGVNVLNTALDGVFKQATMYAGLDRGLRELNDPNIGRSLSEFLASGRSLDEIPEQVLQRSFDDARRFTFQRLYTDDTSAFGEATRSVINLHQRLPFVVSAGLGVPFPRYIANHLEHINDYTPIGIVTGGLSKLDTTLYRDVTLVGDAFKTGTDRVARQITGASLIMLGAYSAAQKEGEIDYDQAITDAGVLDLGRTTGPWLMNFLLGDLYYRWRNDLPIGNISEDMLEVALGTTDLGFQGGLVTAVVESLREGRITEDLARGLGDIGATFTYPLTITRDLAGSINPDAAATPYTRDVFGGSLDEPETYGEGNYLDEMLRRATRFLADVSFMQYTQTYNGRNDIPYYGPFNSQPLGSFNPLSRQFGFAATPRPNQLQRELNRLRIEEFDLYTNSTVPNPAVDVVVRERLARSLPQRFYAWADQVEHGGIHAGRTYNQIEDDAQKELLIRNFISNEIRSQVDQVEEAYSSFLRDNPRAAAGYIRNMYVVDEQRLAKETNNDEIYDSAVSIFTEGRYETAQQYLEEAETIYEELDRRQMIMTWANQVEGDFVPFPEQRRR